MMTLQVQVPDELAMRVKTAAEKRGVTVDQFVAISVDETLGREAELETVLTAVLSENAELYKRLA
ncbi:MAG: hypothetical protein JWO56_1957 [Acidobacteria bacterium]|nr:hypothetical protein [Acidobacteriota bacterium]